MNYTTVTPDNLAKISQNFLSLASAFSDDSNDDDNTYSSYMNLSLSPEEIQKRLKKPWKADSETLSSADEVTRGAMTGQRIKKSSTAI